ncbi:MULTISPECIES: hypothetical protein [Pseudofrankia]|uniref:hypothetical protein n=1 Tax=Pseudofrankia TaxID=2994363 RepID=UPI000234C486|nr:MULTISPECIES: hypothetical protein [Pseudofrankia]
MADAAPQAVLDEKVDVEYRQFFVKDEGFYEACVDGRFETPSWLAAGSRPSWPHPTTPGARQEVIT